jgi:hypothetical protein
MPGGYKDKDLALQVRGSLESETVKYGHEPGGFRICESLSRRGPVANVRQDVT